MKNRRYIIGVAMLMSLMLLGCSKEDNGGLGGDGAKVETVKVRFLFSTYHYNMRKKASTRMTSDVVQETGLDRGIDDARVLCYDSYPSATSTKIGEMIEFKNHDDDIISTDTTSKEVSEFREVGVPVGTTHFGFYGSASGSSQTHDDRMKYGVIEVAGLSKSTYRGNSSIRFKPVQICSSGKILGGSEKGANLLALLNELMAVNSTAAAPNNLWSTAENPYLSETYTRMTELKTLSSQHVSIMLSSVYWMISLVSEGDPGKQLADALIAKISSAFMPPEEGTGGISVLKDDYQGFPADIHLPMGAARIEWDANQKQYIIPDVQAYGKQLNIMSMTDYCYPMNLQYQVLSDIVASDSLIVMPSSDGGESAVAEKWKQLIDSLYLGASSVVQNSTQSVAMKQQVNYAVGKLALRSRIASSDVMYDAMGRVVDVSNGFTLKGYIIGGQREVDYNFQPVAGSREYAIYDTDLNGGSQQVKRHYWTEDNFVLGLGTAADKDIYIALELVNNCADFQGADGLIAHGATFYLVANLSPREGQNYSSGSIDQIFSRDKATAVNLTIEGGYPDTDGDGKPDTGVDNYGRVRPVKGLATATYGLPNLEVGEPTVGLSVNLRWEEGLFYEEIVL